MKINTCIVIPCYNEAKKLISLKEDYIHFLNQNRETLLCFVNDGSKDKTFDILTDIKKNHPNTIEIVSYNHNKGKAEAVRRGINHCNDIFDHEYIAYLDTDLSTTLSECLRVRDHLIKNQEISFVFGSRIARVGSTIKRSFFRFLIGRFIATLISGILKLKVYDTQCGCKVFKRDVSEQLFIEEFISKWLFDVEIFFRMYQIYGKEKAVNKMEEIPLISWIDHGGSKVSMLYFFKLWFDLNKINNKYKKRFT